MLEIGRPPLASRRVCTNVSHILLDRALTDMDAQFQQFPANPLCAPEPIVLRNLPNQRDGFLGYPWLVRRGLGPAFPIQAKELPMPPKQGVWLHDHEGLPPGSNHTSSRTRRMRSALVIDGRFTCRLRMMSWCHKSAFSAISSDLLRPRSVRVESGKEVPSGFVQRAK